MTVTPNKILLVAAVVCLFVAFIITAGWVDAEGNARDCWALGGLVLWAGSGLP